MAFESRKAVALLGLLVVAGEPRRRSDLATTLWPESNSKRARGALRYTLSLLQSTLGKEWFQTDRESIGLAQSVALVVDCNQFEKLLGAGQDHAHTSDIACDECLKALIEAIGIYRGDFLTGFSLRDSISFDEWQFFQREAFRHQLANGLRSLIRYYSQQIDYPQSLNYARRLLHLDPLQESVHRELMQLYAASGQWEQALRQFETCAELLESELGVPPSPATVQLYEEIRQRKLAESSIVQSSSLHKSYHSNSAQVEPRSQSTSQGADTLKRPNNLLTRDNLSISNTPILGRNREIGEISELLCDEYCRMVTVLGPGGIGKTRLAYQVADNFSQSQELLFRDGVYFVPLAAVHTDELLIAAVARALGFSFNGPNPPKEQLLQYLASQQLLVVLDNFEQLVHSGLFLGDLLNAASGISLLVTSRERLNLHEEWLYEIQGLPLPPSKPCDASKLVSYDVIQLFNQRAKRLAPRFDLNESLLAVVEICRLLQGMPLGIELAAGWVRAFSCSEISRQIRDDIDFLATSAQNVPERHRSLRAAFLHSWHRLTSEEQTVFAKASIFRGGFSLEAAKATTGATPILLSALVDKSIVQRSAGSSERPDRYNIHELLRQYAEEELSLAEKAEIYRQHCTYFAAFVEKRLQHRSLSTEVAAFGEIRSELENIRVAWGWLVAQIQGLPGSMPAVSIQEHDLESLPESDRDSETDGALLGRQLEQFVPMLGYYFLRHSLYAEGAHLLSDAAKSMRTVLDGSGLPGDLEERYTFWLAQVEARLAELAFNLSRFQEVADTYQRLLPIFRGAENKSETGGALIGLGKALVRMGRYAEAEPLILEGLSTFQSIEDDTGISNALNGLGILYSNQGRFDVAQTFYEQFLAIGRANQHKRSISNALNNLGSNYARAGHHTKALPLYQECHRLAVESGEQLMVAAALSNLGSVSRSLGQLEESRNYYIESIAICREIGERRWTAAGLNGLGLTLIDDNCHAEAQTYLRESIAIVKEIDSLPDMLDALAALGEIALVGEDSVKGEIVLNFVAKHSITQTPARKRSEELLMRFDDSSKDRDPLEGHQYVTQKALTLPDIIALVLKSEA